MFHGLSDEPNEYVAVKHQIFQIEFLFEFIFVDKCRLELSFAFRTELFDLYLLCEIHPVLRHSLEDGFFRTSVYRELLVLLFIFQVVDLIFRQSLLLYR